MNENTNAALIEVADLMAEASARLRDLATRDSEPAAVGAVPLPWARLERAPQSSRSQVEKSIYAPPSAVAESGLLKVGAETV